MSSADVWSPIPGVQLLVFHGPAATVSALTNCLHMELAAAGVAGMVVDLNSFWLQTAEARGFTGDQAAMVAQQARDLMFRADPHRCIETALERAFTKPVVFKYVLVRGLQHSQEWDYCIKGSRVLLAQPGGEDPPYSLFSKPDIRIEAVSWDLTKEVLHLKNRLSTVL
jgi:hypothetical protein